MRVVVAEVAEAHVRAIDDWWRENRPSAPSLFREELASAFEILAALPFAGQPYDHPTLDDVRRVLLRATR